jgi:predicted transcriptional regulator
MSVELKKTLEKIISGKAPGPSPTFSIFHMLHAIELIAEKKLGRGKLADSLNVGEGAARTMVDRLKSAGLIETSKAGCALTARGVKFWREYKLIFEKKVEIGENELTLSDCNFAIHVKNRGSKIQSGVEQRDAAVRAGAKGATTIVFADGKLKIPSVSHNAESDFPKATAQIFTLFKLEENDVIIIVSAEDLRKANYGALAAAWTLIEDC